MHVGQAERPPLELIGELRVVEAEQMQHRRVQIVHVNPILRHIEAKFVGLAETDARPSRRRPPSTS